MTEANSSIREDSSFISDTSLSNRESPSAIIETVYSNKEPACSMSEAEQKFKNFKCDKIYTYVKTPPKQKQSTYFNVNQGIAH